MNQTQTLSPLNHWKDPEFNNQELSNEASSTIQTEVVIKDPNLRKEMKNKSLGLIFYECSLMTMKINREGNKLSLAFKRESQNRMEEIIRVKIKSYDRFVAHGALPALKAAVTLIGLGGGALEIGTRAFCYALDSAENQLNDAHQGSLAGMDHRYKTQNEMTEQMSKSRQDYRQHMDAILRIVEQAFNAELETIKRLAQPS